jgi:trehalose 6-phosphate phosphatase
MGRQADHGLSIVTTAQLLPLRVAAGVAHRSWRAKFIKQNRRIRLVPPDARDLRHIAILLDVDGTILDIAPTPASVDVPASLRRALAVVSERVGGALALVSGRPLPDLDSIFAPLRLPAIGGHGAELRLDAGGIERCAEPLDAELRRELGAIAARHPGVIAEDKGYSVALHYRKAPAHGLSVVHEVKRACAANRSIELLAGKAVIEVKAKGFNKGTAVRALMTHPPFRGRVPIFIGDDRTDEAAFAVVPEFRGQAISVGRKVAGVADRFETPADVRRWLERLSDEVAASP